MFVKPSREKTFSKHNFFFKFQRNKIGVVYLDTVCGSAREEIVCALGGYTVDQMADMSTPETWNVIELTLELPEMDIRTILFFRNERKNKEEPKQHRFGRRRSFFFHVYFQTHVRKSSVCVRVKTVFGHSHRYASFFFSLENRIIIVNLINN